jgi:hypothetical protein
LDENTRAKVPGKLDQLIREALAIEAQEAKEAGALGYMARALTQATMPHSDPKTHTFERVNGAFTLTMLAPPKIGLPYGSVPRLLVSWVTTEAIRTRSHVLELGSTLSAFMSELDLIPTGGRWGSITRLRSQMRRLFSSSVSCIYDDDSHTSLLNIQVAEEAHLWWDPKSPDQAALWKSTVTLGRRFYEEAISSPVPIDMRALKALRRSPMALDIYCWLTHRMSYLKRRTIIPWPALQLQFGADYTRTRDFKEAFLQHLRAVCVVYPEAKVCELPEGLELEPSPPHIARLPRG